VQLAGIVPAVADKLLQIGVSKILEDIYEQDFLGCSYGYRPGIGVLDAVRDVSAALRTGPYHFVVEADIRGFFDKIDHGILVELLQKRIDDKPFLRLIRKWLKAGILETDGKVIHPETGSPQGGIVSPILANIYLHYALDVWFEETVKAHCRGAAYLCRYADDFICAFENETDAKRFYEALGKRMSLFKLELAEEKTNLLKFSRLDRKHSGALEFLGFEFRWGFNHCRRLVLKRRTARKKYRASLAGFYAWIKANSDAQGQALRGPQREALRVLQLLRCPWQLRQHRRLLLSGNPDALPLDEPPQSAAELQLERLCRADQGLQAPATTHLPQLLSISQMSPSAKRVTSRSPVR
jgi:group II intron reverse transcriptase/maturase